MSAYHDADIKRAAALARELGLSRIRLGDLELWLGEAPPAADSPLTPENLAKANEELARRRKAARFAASNYEPPPREESGR